MKIAGREAGHRAPEPANQMKTSKSNVMFVGIPIVVDKKTANVGTFEDSGLMWENWVPATVRESET